MTHSNIIIIVIGVSLASTAGVYVSIKKIIQYTSTPVNTLTRRGDIELNDFMEPHFPEQVHYDMRFERISSGPTSQVSNITNYPNSDIWVDPHSPDGDVLNEYWFNINSCLENVNHDFIHFMILLLILIMAIIIIFKYQTILRFFNNDKSKIVFTEGISSNIITYTEDYQDLLSSKITDGINYHIVYEKPDYYTLPHHWTLFNIKDWLDTLNEQDYAVTFHLCCIPSQELYYNTPDIILTNEFMVNKSSNPALISVLLYQQLDYFYNSFNVGYYENHTIVIRYKALNATY